MLLEATRRRWADLAPYGGRATSWWSLSATASLHDPWQGPQSQSPSLDHKCAFSQWLEMRAHGSMGPHEKQTDVISEEHASSGPYDMWDMLLEESRRSHLSLRGRVTSLGSQPTWNYTHSLYGCHHASSLIWTVDQRSVGSKGKEEMSPGSLMWHHPSL
jgi:hypothetical protein